MARRPEDIYDQWLVLRAQDGDTAALGELVKRWQPRLWTCARRLTGRDDAAGDVTQDSWLAVTRGIRRLDDPAAFPAWVYRIVNCRCRDWQRRRIRGRRITGDAAPIEELPEPSRSDCDDTGDTGDTDRLRDALSGLAAETRQIIWLRYRGELSTTEIARVLDIAEGTVKSRLHAARERLRGALARTNA